MSTAAITATAASCHGNQNGPQASPASSATIARPASTVTMVRTTARLRSSIRITPSAPSSIGSSSQPAA